MLPATPKRGELGHTPQGATGSKDAMEEYTRDPPGSSRQNKSPEPTKKAPQGSEKIRRLKGMANHGFYAMALFVALSIGAVRDFDFIPSFPERIRIALGHPPSANMISTALLIYSFAAIVLILSRMTTGSAKFGLFGNVGYLAGFYFFYHFAGSIEENFWAVFASGMTVLGLETYHLRTFCSEEIRKELDSLRGISHAEDEDA